jgi:hypothetical protein
VARISWFDVEGGHPVIQERINNLESFTSAPGRRGGVRSEVGGQEARLVAPMKALEPGLSDELHAKVTTVLVELSAYNVMRLLHELHAERTRMAVGNA